MTFLRTIRPSAIRTAAVFVILAILPGCPAFKLATPVIGYPGPLEAQSYQAEYTPGAVVDVYYPEAPGPFPLVILNAGWNQPKNAYITYGQALAQWGYVCIIRDEVSDVFEKDATKADEQAKQVPMVMEVIDWATAENANSESALFEMIDTDLIAVSGHSLGGHVAVEASIADPRIDLGIIIDAWFDVSFGAYAEIPVPTMFINSWVGSCGGHTLPGAVPIYDLIDVPKVEVAVVDSAHIDFLERSEGLNAFGQLICGGGTRDKNEVRAIAQRYLISWLNVYLKGLTAFEDTYAGAAAQADIDAHSVTIRHDL